MTKYKTVRGLVFLPFPFSEATFIAIDPCCNFNHGCHSQILSCGCFYHFVGLSSDLPKTWCPSYIGLCLSARELEIPSQDSMIFRYLIFICRIKPTSWLDNTLTSVLRFMLHSMVLRLMEPFLTSRRVCGYSQVLQRHRHCSQLGC